MTVHVVVSTVIFIINIIVSFTAAFNYVIITIPYHYLSYGTIYIKTNVVLGKREGNAV